MEIFLIYPVVIGIGAVTAELARSKGYRGRWWFLASLVIPLLPTFVLFMLKTKKKQPMVEVVAPPTHQDRVLYQKTP
ncbi:MAG: hypothetical protein EAY81_02845 [Bacteroidetes bacterium]|nr:MAG: hypothetical protein EAY81_02845 [Bacteroidota bacterium]